MSETGDACGRCGAANEPGARFCWSCGAPLASAPPPPAAQPPNPFDDDEPQSEMPTPTAALSDHAWDAAGGGSNDSEPSPWPQASRPSETSQPEAEVLTPSTYSQTSTGRQGRPPGGPLRGVNPRSIILIGVVLLVLSCLWFIVALVSKLTIWFSLFCLLPLGVIAVLIGLVLLLANPRGRRF